MFDFGQLEQRKQKNSRTSTVKRGQSYSGLRLTTNQNGSHFEFSNALMDRLGLREANGFFTAMSPDGTKLFAAVVPQEHANCVFFGPAKGDKKSQKVNSSILLDDLVGVNLVSKMSEQDVVQGRPNHQYLDLQEVTLPNTPGFVVGTYEFVVANEDSNDAEDTRGMHGSIDTNAPTAPSLEEDDVEEEETEEISDDFGL